MISVPETGHHGLLRCSRGDCSSAVLLVVGCHAAVTGPGKVTGTSLSSHSSRLHWLCNPAEKSHVGANPTESAKQLHLGCSGCSYLENVMSKVTLNVATVQAALPTGVTAGAFRFSLTDAAGNVVQTQDVNATQAIFAGVADGHYTASVVRVDVNGNVIGTPVTVEFDAANPVVMYDAPSALSVSVEVE